ncbi:transketolase [Alkalilimnicola sp. S0819]|uniref:transketolase n=1 Tax=Alkalilimnicola sp. S0819 TaxID=2613922 RepID=UPI001261F31D|nr:transketolase [Alkalilimnicola sp. S0819]KAB7628141.1 transketolase [Alkalilimnicola sp. S0819]MPQ15026.1 transketolase [Alkalilimnicola sp. S0819]
MPSRRDLANAIRALSMDAVQQANSGHPGAPMGMADIAEVLWNDFLRHNPANPQWFNRDRFVLSNGHGSMLQYSLLHLAGYELSMDDLKNFRQFGSKTPGHPEYGYAPGVETTTGPLGQGLANGVGMALAEKVLAAQFNRPGHTLVDHHTYVFMGDGCLMEGVSHEACSLAGTQGLGKLICFYDDNGISIDGKVQGWFTDDTPARFEAYGWHVVRDVDGHDAEAVRRATEEARAVTDKPSIICCKTVIGFGAPNVCGTHGVHGAPLGADEIQATREFLNWHHEPFEIPEEIYQGWNARERGEQQQREWEQVLEAYRQAHPELAALFERRISGELPESWGRHAAEALEKFNAEAASVATRKASEMALNSFGPYLPELLGGSADLTGSNNTWWSDCTPVSADDADGNYLFYGVREFGMAAVMNGMALHGGFIPYGGTFLVFSDYARNALRMAALMKLRNIFVLTHDSIGLGEDGPTHQPVEHLASLRMIPNMQVWRPCDAVETLVAWQVGLERRDGPTALALTRQGLPHQARNAEQLADIRRGGYILRDCAGEPELILLATGSEVALVMEAAERLAEQGRAVRVVSMPCAELFEAQDAAYREAVLPRACRARIAVEAAWADYWLKYVGLEGRVIGMTGFGESAPAKVLFEHFGFTVDNILAVAEELR